MVLSAERCECEKKAVPEYAKQKTEQEDLGFDSLSLPSLQGPSLL